MTNAPQMTPRQRNVYDAIRAYAETHDGAAPTQQELADQLGVNKVSVYEHMHQLAAKGWITMSPHKARSVRLTGRCEHCGSVIKAGAA